MSQETLYSPMLVNDDDKHFTVDSVTREIIGEKQILVQNDHQSERFTFVVPRFIEKRDIAKCNVVQIYYLNAKKGASATGIYTVDDMEIYEFVNDKVKFSWLISQNATKYAGNLTFMIRFANIDDEGKVHYAWSTHSFSDVAVVESVEAEASFENEYVDVIEQWKSSVMQELTEYTNAMLENRTNEYLTELANAVLENLEEHSDASIIHIVETRVGEMTNTVKQELTEHISEAIVESTEERFAELSDTVTSNKTELDETKANVTDVYTKNETLSPTTKTGLGLSEDAVPDDAFGKLLENAREGAKIVTGSYVGTGTYGESNPNSVTFDFEPKLFCVAERDVPAARMWALRGVSTSQSYTSGSTVKSCDIKWDGTNVSWYSAAAADYQLNRNGITHDYLAIG